MNTQDVFNQITAISKAGAYDAIKDNYAELQAENAKLKSTISQLQIMLKGAEARIEALQGFINEVRPENPTMHPLTSTTQAGEGVGVINLKKD